MLLQDVVEEITEKAPNFLSVPSIIRKVTQVRDKLMRGATGAQQQSDPVVYAMDLLQGRGEYPLPCPAASVQEVLVSKEAYYGENQWERIPYRQFDEHDRGPYYYFLNKTIGIVPEPESTTVQGLKIFYNQALPPLTTNDLNGPTGFDENFDMLLVYGVLVDMGIKEYKEHYDEWLYEYRQANSGYERYVVNERW